MATIRISNELKELLDELRKDGEGYDDVLRRICLWELFKAKLFDDSTAIPIEDAFKEAKER